MVVLMNLELYNSFINEQKEYFEINIQPNFKCDWTDSTWYGGVIGSGWLLSRSGKTHFTFEQIKKLKGLNNSTINEIYQYFIKSVLVLSYRKSNTKASPQKLYAEFLILKRWYDALYSVHQEKAHPCYLSTSILNKSFEILTENSSKTNLPDHAGTYTRLQEILNHYGFTEQSLEFSQKFLYINRQNRTPNARKTKALIDQLELDEDEINKEKLISIQTFINIVSLISLCQTNGEKIVLNLLLILIVTGLRSTEAILLKTNALIKRPLLDPETKKHLSIDGIKQYTVGIQYHGAKGAGLRIHWLEPLAAHLAEMVFASVLELTTEYREHLLYVRSKSCRDFFPKSIDAIDQDYVEVDDLINTCFGVKDNNRGHAGRRDVVIKSLSKLPLYREIKNGQRTSKYYLKSDINKLIGSLANYNSTSPINYQFNYEGKVENIPYEDLLFIHEYRSTTLQRAFYNKTNVIPLNVNILNSFLGGSSNISVFEKYNLLENETEYSKITSHIPRHNINTFLALSGLADHLQAMLMGRVDIKQNQYYQHLALKQRRVTASVLENNALALYEKKIEIKPDYPVQSIKQDGLMYFSKKLDIETNLKMNLQTFNSQNEVADFIKNSFYDEYFKDIAQSFNELAQNSPSQANAMLKSHAYLHPLPFGSCMRQVAIHDCPKRLACQSGDSCGNFTLTGRKDELAALQLQRKKIEFEYNNIKLTLLTDNLYSEMLEDLATKLNTLKELEEKALFKRRSLNIIKVFSYDDSLSKLPNTLS